MLAVLNAAPKQTKNEAMTPAKHPQVSTSIVFVPNAAPKQATNPSHGLPSASRYFRCLRACGMPSPGPWRGSRAPTRAHWQCTGQSRRTRGWRPISPPNAAFRSTRTASSGTIQNWTDCEINQKKHRPAQSPHGIKAGAGRSNGLDVGPNPNVEQTGG